MFFRETLEQRICPVCKNTFQPKKQKQIYDKRICFKQAYNAQSKVVTHPTFHCYHCGRTTSVPFDPIKEKRQWERFQCPCGFEPFLQEMLVFERMREAHLNFMRKVFHIN